MTFALRCFHVHVVAVIACCVVASPSLTTFQEPNEAPLAHRKVLARWRKSLQAGAGAHALFPRVDDEAALQRLRRSLSRANATHPTRVVVLGGSMTSGVGCQNVTRRGCPWPNRLQARLDAARGGARAVEVVNLAIAASCTGCVLSSVVPRVLAHAPDAALIVWDYSVNDADAHKAVYQQRRDSRCVGHRWWCIPRRHHWRFFGVACFGVACVESSQFFGMSLVRHRGGWRHPLVRRWCVLWFFSLVTRGAVTSGGGVTPHGPRHVSRFFSLVRCRDGATGSEPKPRPSHVRPGIRGRATSGLRRPRCSPASSCASRRGPCYCCCRACGPSRRTSKSRCGAPSRARRRCRRRRALARRHRRRRCPRRRRPPPAPSRGRRVATCPRALAPNRARAALAAFSSLRVRCGDG